MKCENLKLQKIVGNLWDRFRKLYLNGHLETLSRPQVIENSSQYFLLRTDVLQKTVVGCPLRRCTTQRTTSNMSKWHLTQPLQREIHKKPMLISYIIFLYGAKIFGRVSHSTELVRMCLACQHFDFNSADWISDNLNVIVTWYLRTMGKEFNFRFSRRWWGRNAWRTPTNVCVKEDMAKKLSHNTLSLEL